MADERLTGLPEATSADDADVVYVVDVSDTTDNAAGSSKKITKANLLDGLSVDGHTHTEADVTDLDKYTQAEVDALLAPKLSTVTASDVDAEASTDGHVLTSDGAGNAAWEAPSGGGGASALDDLTDVTITTPSADQVLKYDGAGWINAASPGGGGGATSTAAGTKILIEEITLSTAGDFDFESIPSGYDRLIIEGWIAGNKSGAVFEQVSLLFNGDTTQSNYWRQSGFTADGSATWGQGESAAAYIATAPGATASSGALAYVRITLEGYDEPLLRRIARSEVGTLMTNGSMALTGTATVAHDSMTDPITSLTLQGESANALTGKLRLYGEKSLTIEDSETITFKQAVPVTLSGGEYIIDLTSYQSGDRVVIEGQVKTDDTAAQSQSLYAYLNDDETATNYYYQILAANTDAFDDRGTGAKIAYLASSHASNDANAHTYFRIVAEDYTNASLRNNIHSEWGAPLDTATTFFYTGQATISRNASAAITKIKLAASAGNLSGTLKAYIEKEGVLPVSQGPHVIEDVELTSDTASIIFSDIPTGYRRLILKGVLRSTQAAPVDWIHWNVNGDSTAANYHAQRIAGDNGVAGGNEYSSSLRCMRGPAASATSGRFATFEMQLEAPDSTVVAKQLITRFGYQRGSVESEVGVLVSTSSETDAVTSLTFEPDLASFAAGTRFTLYGEY